MKQIFIGILFIISGSNIISQEIIEPKPVNGVSSIYQKVFYPEEAAESNIEGKVLIEARIDTFGNPISIEVLESLDPRFDKITINAIKQTKFIPGSVDGKKTIMSCQIPVSFTKKMSMMKSENPSSNSSDQDFFVAVEAMPQPIGGHAAIMKRVVYPDLAVKAKVQGTVVVKAIIDTSGNVEKAEIERGIGSGCDEAAINAVEKTKFFPGKQRGRKVKVQISIPILFRL